MSGKTLAQNVDYLRGIVDRKSCLREVRKPRPIFELQVSGVFFGLDEHHRISSLPHGAFDLDMACMPNKSNSVTPFCIAARLGVNPLRRADKQRR